MRTTLITLACLALLAPARAEDEKRKTRYPKPPDAAGVKLVPDGWKAAPKKALTPTELDLLVKAAQAPDKVTPVAAVPDDVFIRRVSLDLTGKLPGAKEVVAFVTSKEPDKKAKLIDQLLASDDFARHQARYWRDVMLSKATDARGFVKFPRETALEAWLFEQFKANRSWSSIARALITSEGQLSVQNPRDGGDAAMLLAHTQMDGPVERTNDTVRVFLGINISCAQCHDHPDDVWKRQQFHEMAAFYGKLGDRIRMDRESTPPVVEAILMPRPFLEHRMPDQDDPKKTHAVSARFFLDGTGPGSFAPDRVRRNALADKVTAKDNYYFAAAFVNRVWGQLLGQPFVQVDGMGPLSPPVYGEVLLRLADSFRAQDHDVKALYRVIANSATYQRRMKMGDSPTEHVRFAGTYPTRLRPEALWTMLNQVLGPIFDTTRPGPMRPGMGPMGRFRQSLPVVFKELFAFDPSSKPEDVEGTVPQALLMMNNRTLNAQMKATGNTVLAKLLKDQKDDGKAVEGLYLHAMGRRPTANEKKVCLDHIASLKDRGEAFEDLLWSLLNSAEFRTKR
jgi:hypothetical protein